MSGAQSLIAEGSWRSIDIDSAGDLVTTGSFPDSGPIGIYKTDPGVGIPVLVASFEFALDVIVDVHGDYIVTDNFAQDVVRVDATSGARTVLGTSDQLGGIPTSLALIDLPAKPQVVSALSEWGIALLAVFLVGVSVRRLGYQQRRPSV